jgi:hypothetical protein
MIIHKTSLTVGILAYFAIVCRFCESFVMEGKDHRRPSIRERHTQSSQLRVIPADILNDVDSSRTQFFAWFFGASGGAGIARSSFPRMYEQVQYIQSLKGSEPSLGGETLGLNPLCGYPEDLSIKDLNKVLNNRLSIQQIVQKYPIENNFLSRKGYITFTAFEMANKDANPLAVRAIFDTFAQSTDVCDPFIAQDKIDSYKQDISLIKGSLFYSKITGYVAIFTLLFLLGLADFIAFGHARDGWFHYWKLSDGIFSIPDYWI